MKSANTHRLVGLGPLTGIVLLAMAALFMSTAESQAITTGGVASASISYPGCPASSAFDGVATTCWGNQSPNFLPCWLMYTFNIAKVVTNYSLLCSTGDGWATETYNPKTWTLEASNDGVNWTTLDTISDGQLTMDAWKSFSIANSTAYTTYRIHITVNESGVWSRIDELELLYMDETPPVLTVIALAASNIGTNSATLNGRIFDAGGAENPEVTLCWAESDQGTNAPTDWPHQEALGASWGSGQSFSTNVYSLQPGSNYAYRCYATNSTGKDWSDLITFMATPLHVEGKNGFGVSVYANPFDPDLDFDPANNGENAATVFRYGDSALGTVSGWTLVGGQDGVSRKDGYAYNDGPAYMWKNYANGGSTTDTTFLQWTAPLPFRLGTIITVLVPDSPNFTGQYPYDVKVTGNAAIGTSDADWTGVAAAASGTCVAPSSAIEVHTLARPMANQRTVRVRSGGQADCSINTYVISGVKEVLVFEDLLQELAVTNVNASLASYKSNLTDHRNNNYWYDATGTPITNKYAEFSFDGVQTLGAMLLRAENWGDTNQIFTIGQGDGTLVAQVRFKPNKGEFLPIRFDTPLTTDKVRLQWVSGDDAYGAVLGEALFFKRLPEPGPTGTVIQIR